MTQPTESDRVRRVSRRGCLWTAGVAIACITVSSVAALWVISLASGSYQVDALAPARRVFVAWIPVTVASVIAGRLIVTEQRSAWIASLLAVVLGVGAVWVTVDQTRNDAPDGSEHTQTLADVNEAVVDDLEAVLEIVVPGAWSRAGVAGPSPRAGGLDDSPWRCVDTFGRNNGASEGSGTWFIDEDLTDDQVGEVQSRLTERGWSVSVAEELGADDAVAWVHLTRGGGVSASWTITVTTACLRS